MSARVLFGLAALAATSLPSTALAQEQAPAASRRAADAATELALDAWRARHGDGWRARVEPGTGKARFLAGGALAAEAIPEEEGEWFALAERRVDEALPLFDVDPATLERVEVKHLDLVRIGTTDKTVVRFRQRAGGAPVRGGTLSALFGMDGELLALDSTCLPDADELDPEPFVPEAFALRLARARFELEEGVPAEAVDELELVVTRHEERGELRARLAWSIGLVAAPVRGDTRSRRVLVAADAEGGGVLESRSRVHHAVQQGPPGAPQVPQRRRPSAGFLAVSDLDGIVGTFATPGTEADWSGNPPAFETLPFAYVSSASGSATTTANGHFFLPHPGGGSAAVTFHYQGPWARIYNAAGPDSTTTALVFPGATQVHLMNQPPAAHETAEANAFLRINDFRRYVLGIDPSDPTMDFQAQALVNSSVDCNAYYYGGFVEFYEATASCNNTAFSTVIAHEMGHWANDRYGSGNGPDGFGEGAADAWAMYMYDTQYLGEYLSSGGGWVRDGENTRQYCGDGNGGCYGEVHDDGEVLMGALWKVRRNLNNSLGDALGDLTADVLFLSWMQAFDDQQIDSIVEEHWLALDDDDGNLSNGTPHFAEIDGAFVEQGFPGRFTVPPAATPIETQVILGSDIGLWAYLGRDVDVDGDLMVVGCPSDDAVGNWTGCAHVFQRVAGTWTHRQKLIASDARALAHFGARVALSGTRIVVSARNQSVGNAYVFDLVGPSWVEQARLEAFGGGEPDAFGSALALEGDRLVVGCMYYDDPLPIGQCGSAYAFEKVGSTWVPRTKLLASDRAGSDLFGTQGSIALSGDWLAIGAPNHDHASNPGGVVYMFQWNGSSWIERAELQAPGSSSADYLDFGWSVALSGTTLIVGATQTDVLAHDTGAVYVFERAGATWSFLTRIVDPTGHEYDRFGVTVDLDGDRLVIGATGVDTSAHNGGAAFTCERSGGVWSGPAAAVPTGIGVSDDLGFSIAVSGTTMVSGAPDHDSGGAVYVFALP